MFPRYFHYGPLPAVPNINPLLNLGLGLPLETTPIGPTQDISSLFLSSQPNLPTSSSIQAASYCLPQTTQFLGGFPVNGVVDPLMAQLTLSQMLFPLNSGFLQQPTCDPTSNSPESSDPHTIVRAPVLYGNTNGHSVSQASSKETTKSPPDQIVASYAAAARAAAIAYQQPLSSAAEVFLSAAASSASSMASVSGSATTVARSRAQQRRPPVVSTAITTSSTIKAPTSGVKSEGSIKAPLPWNSAWTRIVDRQSDVVVYISPGGSRLKSLSEVRAHLERWLPLEHASAISDDCINSSFCFDANREVRLVSAPDDSIFVFPEDTRPSDKTTNVTEVLSASVPVLPLPTNTDESTSKPPDIATSISAISKSSATSAISIVSKRPGESPDKTLKDHERDTPDRICSVSEAVTGGATSTEDDLIPSKKMRVEQESTLTTEITTPLPSLSNETAETTSTFVARSMAKSGCANTVVPSVVPSILPPATVTPPTPNAYSLAQHLAALHQQALLASAGLIQPTDAAHHHQQHQLFEHYKQQQQQQAVAAAAAAMLLQQQQQHQLQLQQHLQAVYAAALQQQHQLLQQQNPDGNQ